MKLELARIDSVRVGDWVQGYFNPSFRRVCSVKAATEYTTLQMDDDTLCLPSAYMIAIGRAE